MAILAQKVNGQPMESVIGKHESFLTNNTDVDDSYFEKKIEKATGDELKYLKLMYAYFSIKNGFIDKGSNIMDGLDLDMSNGFLSSLMLMDEALIDDYNGNHDEAKKGFDSAIDFDTSKINKWLRMELYFFYQESIDFRSFGYLEEALKIDSNFNLAKIEKSYQLDEGENCMEIIGLLESIPASYQDSNAMNLLGAAHINCRNFDRAKDVLNKSISYSPNTNNYYTLAKLMHEYYGDFDSSEELFGKSLALDTTNIDAINGYGWLLYDKGDIQEAEKKLLSLLEYSDASDVYIQLTNFFFLTNQFDKAADHIARNKSVNGKSYVTDGHEIILNIFNKSPYKDLIKQFKANYSIDEIEWFKNQTVFFFGEL